jgi:hypothetical protein
MAISGKTPVRPSATIDVSKLIRPASEIVEHDARSVMVIGPMGSWKTSSLRTIPKRITDPDTGEERDCRVLLIETDGRDSVLRKVDIPHFSFLRLPYDPKRLTETYQTFHALIDTINNGGLTYDVIILDSSTPVMNMLWDMSHDPSLGVGGDPYNTHYKETGGGEQGNERNWGFMTVEFSRLIFALRGACIWFVLICHDAPPYFREEQKGNARYTPDLAGKLKKMLPKTFAEVYYTTLVRNNDTKRDEWLWLTQTFNNREARTTFPDMPRFVPQDYSIIIGGNWKKYTLNGKEQPDVTMQET